MKTPEVERVEGMIKQYLQQIGLKPDECYNQQNNAWYWFRGSAKVEIFVSESKVTDIDIRYYLRVYSAVYKVPQNNQLAFYRRLLDLNDTSLGMKFSTFNEWVYVTTEKNIEGMDYKEMTQLVYNLELWADRFDDLLRSEFPDGSASVGAGTDNTSAPPTR